jgi:hypothetical protein
LQAGALLIGSGRQRRGVGVAVVGVGAGWSSSVLFCRAWLLVEVGQSSSWAPWEHGKDAACIPSMRLAGISKDQAWEGATNTAATYGVWR